MTILILQPIRPPNPPELRAIADALLERLEGANPGMTFDICQDDSAVEVPPHPSRYMRHATVRNYMLDTYLRPEHTHVLWIDSDLIDYPADLPSLLMEAAFCCPMCRSCDRSEREPAIAGSLSWWRCFVCNTTWPGDHITAPFAMLDKWPNRFYDIGGFIEKGNRARMWPPYFDQQGDVIDLDSVGCCYLAPAGLYRPWLRFDPITFADGGQAHVAQQPAARYRPPPTDYYVEHWSVMQEAKRRGVRVCALSNVRVIHAWLPDYGLGLN